MSDLFLDRSGVYIETVSIGKGFVKWNVHFPTLAIHSPQIKRQYEDLQEVCKDVKQFLQKEEVDPETVELVERECPDVPWGSGR